MKDFTAARTEAEAQRLYGFLGKMTDFKAGGRYTLEKCRALAPYTLAVNNLKKTNDAVILAHYYCAPEIVYGVADFRGDSYALAKKAAELACGNIIFCGVYFMAQTAKIVNPGKRVYLPPAEAGCSLADGIDAKQTAQLREKYPDAAFVCYINSSAEVKALCDVCVTSSNVYDITAALPKDKIVFIPDLFMAENIKAELNRRGVRKEVISFGATCCVHDKYTLRDALDIRGKYPSVKIISHPECALAVCEASDYCGSTSGMLEFVKNSDGRDFAVFSEDGIVNSLEFENPSKTFYSVSRACGQMKRNTLDNILGVLKNIDKAPQIQVSEDTALKARLCIDNMFKMAGKK